MGKQNNLGRCLQKSKANRVKQMKQIKAHNSKTDEWILKQHMPEEKIVESEYKPKSVIQQDHIEEMFDMREIAQPTSHVWNPEDSTKDSNVRIIYCGEEQSIPQVEESPLEIMERLNRSIQQLPIRPTWRDRDANVMKHLDAIEKEEFFKWRKTIHEFQTTANISLTPYEKSLNVWRQLWHVVENSDLVCQIVDARDPLLFYCATIKTILSEYFQNKTMILLLNKADLLTDAQRSRWWNYFQSAGIDVYFWSAIAENDKTTNSKNNQSETDSDTDINSDSDDDDDDDNHNHNNDNIDVKADDLEIIEENIEPIQEHRICSRSELIGIFENYAAQNQSEVYAIGMIGFPNVGKSSTLNQILQMKKVGVSATPGKTKHFQTFMLNKTIKLIDCPGLVFPTFVNSLSHIILAGVLPIDNIRDLSHAMKLMVSRIPQYVFEYTYNIKIPTTKNRVNPDYCTSEELLSAFSVMRGLLTSCGVANLSEGSKILLKDYINGKLIYVQSPPSPDTVPMDFNNYYQIKQLLADRNDNSQSYCNQMHSKIIKMSNMVDETNMESRFQQKLDRDMVNNLMGSSSTNPMSFIDVTNKHWRKQAKKKKGKLRRKYKDLEGTPYDY